VTPTPLLRHLQALIRERHPLSSPEALRWTERYLLDQFRALGLDTTTHAFQGLGSTYHNVIASIPARTGDRPPLILAAHYDTVMYSPGADDNASGVAVLLEAARRLQAVPLEWEVRLIGFCLEEEDLLGSLAYVGELRAQAAALLGAIVLECVGFASAEPGSQLAPAGLPIAVPPCGDFLAIVANGESAALAKAIEGAANREVSGLKTVSVVVPGRGELFPDTRRSDHAAFWQFGYPAVMLTDTANFRNPHYHRSTDTLETLDLAFLERVLDAVVAVASTLAARGVREA
jgi:Zn-dependent M28 family amino/carboxypeptidase